MDKSLINKFIALTEEEEKIKAGKATVNRDDYSNEKSTQKNCFKTVRPLR